MSRAKFSQSGIFNIDFEIAFKDRGFKRLLNKLKAFLQYNATVGIHSTEGKKIVNRKYIKSGKNYISGKSYRMNIIKLAYQNEFGADIIIKPKYRSSTRVIKTVYHTLKHRYITKTIEKYSALRKASEQGYLLLNKRGKFVAYFKPNSIIHIPSRSFLRKVIYRPTTMLQLNIIDVLNNIFVKNGYNANYGFKKIAGLVQQEVIKNIEHNGQANHPLTVKAKGFNDPLVDEHNRLSKSIKYKIYKGLKGKEQYKIQNNIHSIDKALKTIKDFENQGTFDAKILPPLIFGYKGFNPNFE